MVKTSLFRRLFTALIVLLIAAGGLWAEGARESVVGGPHGAAQGAVHLRVATLRGPTGMGMVRLMDQTKPLAANVTATYEVVGTPEVMVSRILAGDVDFASLPLNLAAKLYNSGVQYELAAVNVLGVLYLVSDGIPVDSLQALKGHTVYLTGKGANPDFLFRYVLEKSGLKPDTDVTLDFKYDQVELSSMLIAGRVKLALLPEPFVTQVVNRNPADRVVMRFEDAWKKALGRDVPLAQGCIVVKKKTLEEHPEAVAAFLSAYKGSIAWVNENHGQAGVLIAKHKMGLDAEAAARAIPRMSLVYEPAQKARPSVEEFLNVLLKFSPASIGGRLPDSGFYLRLP